MPELPTGTVTFLFTDIEGSTRLWEEQPDTMRLALTRHDALLRNAIETNGGHVFKTIGDAFCAAFSTAADALEAAKMAQKSLYQVKAGVGGDLMLKVRMALHTGTAEHREGDYFGQPLNRVARLLSVGHGGQVLLSQTVRDLLPQTASVRDLGQHRLKDLQQPEQVWQLISPEFPSDFPPLRSLSLYENNLPQQLSTFIGRDKQIQDVKSLLSSKRLLSLTGSGGCGKTRLALQVAAEVLESYPDGVWVVELAPLADASLVPQTVAEVLGIRETGAEPITKTLLAALKDKQRLLVLDNCEHVLEAAARLADMLLKSCPRVRILVSSREALGIAGESAYRVPSLALPDLKSPQTPESLSLHEAPSLFIERALATKADFMVTERNASTLAQVCHRLDGIPLAIELAAARICSLTIEELDQRLDNRFRILTGGSRMAMARHQTLRATLDWSYDLLDSPQKTLLARLSVFLGGWSLETAGKVCSGDGVEEWEVLDLMTALVDKCLVTAQEQGVKTRYGFLETVRQYAQERLASQVDESVYRRQHRDYFLQLAEEAYLQLTGPEQGRWLALLEQEHDNLRQALSFCLQAEEEMEAGLRLGAALQRFWWTRGHLTEGIEHLRVLLSHPRLQEPTQVRANALNGAGNLAGSQGDYASAQVLHNQGLAIRRALGDKRGIALSLNNLGVIALDTSNYPLARTLGEESLEIQRELGNQWGIALSLNNLGNVVKYMGEYPLARTLCEESLLISRELGDKTTLAYSLYNLGFVALRTGDYPLARTLCQESLKIRWELEDTRNIAFTLEVFAVLASVEKQVERAVHLWGATERQWEEISAPMPPNDQEDHDRAVAAARQSMSEAAFSAAWAQGRTMTLEQAIAYAMEESFNA